MKKQEFSWVFLIPLFQILLITHVTSVYGQCIKDQKELLFQLKDGLQFDASVSTRLVKWNKSTEDCCKWEGVSCDGSSGFVIGLELDGEAIYNGINSSSSLYKFQNLQRLNLANNNFNSTEIPLGLFNLTSLTYLNLSNCGFAGQVPERFSLLTRLEILDLSASSVSGKSSLKIENPSLKAILQNLKELTQLNLDSVNMTTQAKSWSQAISSSLPNLRRLSMKNSHVSGPIDHSFESVKFLSEIFLDQNNLNDTLPEFLANFKNLTVLHLSYCTIPSAYFKGLDNLVHVDLGFNLFTGSISSSLFALQSLRKIKLLQNQFSGLLANFSNASRSQLDTLDLSSNNLNGSIPLSWFELKCLNILSLYSNQLSGLLQLDTIHKLGNLTSLDLSYNKLSIETSRNSSSQTLLPQYTTFKLASCQLKSFPILENQLRLSVLDLSDNQIGGAIPNWTWSLGNGSLTYLNFSQNRLVSLQEPYDIPRLSVLDLHSNQLTGKIPVPPETALYVDYSANNFSSSISPDIGKNLIAAYFFSVSRNKLTGAIPNSICQAIYLKVLDMSNNGLSGVIPSCLLGERESLVVLNLGENNFSGFINGTFVENCGKVPENWFLNWTHMWGYKDDAQSEINHLRFKVLKFNDFYYQDTVTVTSKGLEVQLVKILTIFNSIDISCNQFEGNIPENVAKLKELYILNISHNALTGSIPPAIGNLKQLEALDFSVNKLSGRIPVELANLNFLSYLNLSNNQLTGSIPTWSQFSTFEEGSFRGNEGLCGKILNRTCRGTSSGSYFPPLNMDHYSSDKPEGILISAVTGFFVGLGIVVLPLLYYKKWRTYYYEHVNQALAKFLPMHSKKKKNRKQRRGNLTHRGRRTRL
ncbi:putative leucine-rich repeat domain, L domain-containing protein [Heracleum sosnowskyi]|uniref:Leucine-rich repeat domain, L domain-containing protein n=1 Tax=Heracleum sosnowskyi TaxID=360622 RepID=A0AAD8J8N3_9APIA|nr:putative leucine-rich repeat domain, L domain-containing protein [Heracleum sosnowskyi]